jgi:hypothetical protein
VKWKIGVSGRRTRIVRLGNARLMADTSDRGYTHRDLRPVIQVVMGLHD